MSGSQADHVSEEDAANKNFDALMAESEHFLEQIRAIPEFQGSYLLKFNAWRSKRRDKGLHHTMTGLIRRIKSTEELLRDNIIQIVEKKLALRDQARHLKCRLKSCIAYNMEYVQSQENYVEEMRKSVNGLSAESSDVKAAVAFNCELVRQKIIQTVKQNRTMVSCTWYLDGCLIMEIITPNYLTGINIMYWCNVFVQGDLRPFCCDRSLTRN
jgi:hypothetical protein